MTPDAGELMALASRIEKRKLNRVPAVGQSLTSNEWLNDGERDMIVSALRIAASQPDREAVARIICYWHNPSTCHDAYCIGRCIAVAPDEQHFKAADAILSLLSVQVDGEQKITPLTKQEFPGTAASVPSLRTNPELLAALERAKSHIMTSQERYEQRRSFIRGMCPSNRNYAEWCVEVDKMLPPMPAVAETDADAPGDAGLVSGISSDPTLSAEGMREAVKPSIATRPATSGTAASGTELGGEG